jgi:hypothetical protein
MKLRAKLIDWANSLATQIVVGAVHRQLSDLPTMQTSGLLSIVSERIGDCALSET